MINIGLFPRPSVESIASLSKTFNPLKITSLSAKINWVFGLCLAYLTAYNLYKVYQLKCHTSLELDDQLKLVKCKAIFKEIQEEALVSAEPKLQKCETLLASMRDKNYSYDKEKLWMKLAQYYAENNLDHSYRIAQRLSSSAHLFTVARCIQQKCQNFNPTQLDSLFNRAFEAWFQEIHQDFHPNRAVDQSLEFAKVFHSLQNARLEKQSLEQALSFASTHANHLNQIKAFCKIAKDCQEIGNLEFVESSITSAQQKFLERMPAVDLILAHLRLADAFLALSDYEKMDQELSKIVKLFLENLPLATIKGLYPCVEFIKKIRDNNVSSKFNTFDVEETFIGPTLNALRAPQEPLNPTDRAEYYLSIASIYQKILNNTDQATQVTSDAFKEIQSLPENTDEEIDTKIGFLTHLILFYKEAPDEARDVMKILKDIYDRLPDDSTSNLWWDKRIFGREILQLYHEIKLDGSKDFLKEYLSYFEKQRPITFDTINQLITSAECKDLSGNRLPHEQIKDLLEVAEKLSSQLTSSVEYKCVLALIAKKYVHMDRQKALQLLESYENYQARRHLIVASINAIAAGILYYHSTVIPPSAWLCSSAPILKRMFN